MPNFLNWPSALIAASAAIPLLLLLYFLKLRRREMLVSSTLLWKKSIQDLQVNAPFQRLRKNLLLFLQLLLLLFLLLALARPVVNYTPGAGKVSVILIDRSASMSATDVDGRTRLDEAKRQALQLVETMDKDATASVIAFDDSAEIMSAFTSDRTIVKRAIESIRPTDRASRLKTAFQLAEAKSMAFYADRPVDSVSASDGPQLWLYSDGRVLDGDELRLKSRLKFTKIGTEEAHNVGIVALSAKRNYERPTELQVFVRLANFGPRSCRPALQLSVDGQVPPGGVRSDLLLHPERWSIQEREKADPARQSAEFTLELPRSAVIHVAVKENSGDVLAADDEARIVVPPPRLLNVMLVTPTGNLWLEKFLESANLKNPAVVGPAYYSEKIEDPHALAGEYDVILFDGWQPQKLPPAGNFVFFYTVPPESKIKRVIDTQGPVILKDQWVLDWDRSHPMLRGLNMNFVARDTLKLEVPLDAQVLVEGTKGPLIVMHRELQRTHLVVALDIQPSDWPLRQSFPIFLDYMLQYMALGADMDVRQAYLPGATPRIPRYNLQQAGAGITKVRLSGPPSFGKSEVTVPPAGDFALPALERVGVYSTDPPIPQFERLAVNLLDESESNLIPEDRSLSALGEVMAAQGAGKARLDLWWWIVAAVAAPLCLLEWWVYTRRVHL